MNIHQCIHTRLPRQHLPSCFLSPWIVFQHHISLKHCFCLQLSTSLTEICLVSYRNFMIKADCTCKSIIDNSEIYTKLLSLFIILVIILQELGKWTLRVQKGILQALSKNRDTRTSLEVTMHFTLMM